MKKNNIWKELIAVVALFAIASLVKIILMVSLDILPPKGIKILDGAFILFTSLGVLFFIRWLIVDAPLSFLRRFTIIPLLKTFISLILYFIAAVYLLHRLVGIDLTPLLTTSAVLTGIIALSLQETLKNLFTGIWINTERVVAKGDWVSVAGKEGQVMDVTWRTTRLMTFSNDYVYLPNKILAEGTIENFTYPSSLHIVEIDVSLGYHEPPNRVKDVLLKIASENTSVLKDPTPEVYVVAFGEFAINYRLRAWISDYGAILRIKSDLHYSIWYAFKRNSLEIPYPIRTIYQYQYQMKKEEGILQREIEAYLRKIDFLKPLGDIEIHKVSAFAKIELYGRNEVIFKQDEKGESCFFIKHGAIDIMLKDARGTESWVATLGEGGFFGEMSLLTGEKRMASAVAKEDSELIVIDPRGFYDVFKNNPDLMERLSEIVAARSLELEMTRKRVMTEIEKIEEQKAASKNLLGRIKLFFKIK